MENEVDNSKSSTTPTPIGSNQSPVGSSSLPVGSVRDDNMETISSTTKSGTIGGTTKLRSPVWNHFKKVIINAQEKAVCNYCEKALGGKSKHGTTHLRDHFKICPRRQIRDIRQHILVKEQNKVDEKFHVSNYHFDQDVSRKELAEMIILHEYPLSLVDHYGFRKFSASLQPLFKIPSRKTIRSDILQMYEHEKERTMALLQATQSRIALTTDMWTASNQKKGFMAITAHFIDNQWNMQNIIIRFVYVPCPHTSDVLSHVLFNCMLDWNLDRKLSTLTVDNCSTNDAIIRNLLDKLCTTDLLLDGQLLHMRCCAHILNLIVQDGLAIISDGIEKVRDSVAFWTASPKRQQKFEETTRQLNIPSTKKLALDCKTRWNSTYLMLSVALVYKEVFMRLQIREELFKCCPSTSDWEVAENVCSKLQLFYNVTEKFSGTKYPTANIFFPEICEIRFSLLSWKSSSSSIIQSMATNMMTKFDKYWSTIHGIMSIAAVLDPRYKMKLLEYFFPQLYGSDASHEIGKVKELCYDLVDDYQSRVLTKRSRRQSEVLLNMPSKETSQMMLGFDSFVNESDDMLLKSELDHYLEEKVIPRSVDFDILTWWKTNGFKYPTLQQIARDILAVPISTVASESAFSTGGRWISPHRSRLHPKTIEALMCGQNWLRSNIQVNCSNKMDDYCQTIEYDSDYDVHEEDAPTHQAS